MQQSNLIKDIVVDIERITKEINQLLNEGNEFDNSLIDVISELYDMREIYLLNLQNWYNSPEGMSVLSNNRDKWQKIISTVIEIDNQNLEIIQSQVFEKSNKLKNLTKQKSLLIYSQGNL